MKLEEMTIEELELKIVDLQQIEFCYRYVETQHRSRAAELAGYSPKAVAEREEMMSKLARKACTNEEYIKARNKADQLLRNISYKLLQREEIKVLIQKLSRKAFDKCLEGSVIKKLVEAVFLDPTEMLRLASSVNGNQAEFFRLLNATGQGRFLTGAKVSQHGDINIKWIDPIAAMDRLSKIMGWDKSALLDGDSESDTTAGEKLLELLNGALKKGETEPEPEEELIG